MEKRGDVNVDYTPRLERAGAPQPGGSESTTRPLAEHIDAEDPARRLTDKAAAAMRQSADKIA